MSYSPLEVGSVAFTCRDTALRLVFLACFIVPFVFPEDVTSANGCEDCEYSDKFKAPSPGFSFLSVWTSVLHTCTHYLGRMKNFTENPLMWHLPAGLFGGA